MRMNLKKSASYKRWILLAAVIIVIAAVVVVFVIQWRKELREREKIGKGIAYLKSLEDQDISEIDEEIKVIKSELNLDIADTDEAAVWSRFENAAILGDSRAVGFYYHEFVPEERVMAQGGGKITDVPGYIEQLKKLNPEQIFLCFGLNDIGIGFWPTPEDYNAAYVEEMDLLAAELPNSTVYINSILPAVGVGLEADPNYPRIGEYNEGLKALCEEKGYHFIDNTEMAEEHADLYQEDGLHVETEFYKYWAANMLTEVEE